MPTEPFPQNPQAPFLRMCYLLGDLLFLTALVFVSLALHPDFYHPYTALKYFTLAFFSLLFLPVICLILGFSQKRLFTGIFPYLVLGWLGALVLASVFAEKRSLAFQQTGFFIACAIFSFWAFLRAQNTKLLSRTAGIIGFICVLGVIYGFAQYNGEDFLSLDEPGKAVAFWGNANFASQFLILALPLMIAFFLTGPYRFLSFFVVLLALFHLMLLKSRGGILGVMAGFLFLGACLFYLYSRRKSGPELRLIRFSPLIVVILILGILLTGFTFLFLQHWDLAKEMGTAVTPEPDSNRYRLLAWMASLKMALDNPVLGVGPNNYRFLHPLYASEELWHLQGIFSQVRHVRAHNDYINILCEAGIVGLGMFLCVLGWLALRFYRALRDHSRSWNQQFFLVGLGAGVVSTMAQSVFDFNLFNPSSGLVFWIVAGFLAGTCHAPVSSDLKPRRTPVFALILLIVSVLFLFFIPGRLMLNFRGERLLRKADIHFKGKNYTKAGALASSVLAKDPKNIDAAILLADSLRNIEGKEKQAIQAYQYWARLDPYFVPIYNRMGESYFRLGDRDKARQAFEKALSINPHSVPVLLNLGNIALGAHKPEIAISYYKRSDLVGGDLVEQNQAQYGVALMQLKKYEQAIPRLEQGVPYMEESIPFILELLGDCYVFTERYEDARETYIIALLFGKNPKLLKKVNNLRGSDPKNLRGQTFGVRPYKLYKFKRSSP